MSFKSEHQTCFFNFVVTEKWDILTFFEDDEEYDFDGDLDAFDEEDDDVDAEDDKWIWGCMRRVRISDFLISQTFRSLKFFSFKILKT